jgi:hypothetical protein
MEGYACADGQARDDPARLLFPLEAAPALEALLKAFPTPLELRALPLARVADSVATAARLLAAGVLVVVDGADARA